MKKSRFRSVLFFIKELWNRFFDDDITATSAQLTYYLLFSLFPFFLFLVALLPVIGNYDAIGICSVHPDGYVYFKNLIVGIIYPLPYYFKQVVYAKFNSEVFSSEIAFGGY